MGDNAEIIHFHGPKIWSVRALLDSSVSQWPTPPHHVELFEQNPYVYRQVREKFESYLQ